jgi:hypothetical protein
LSKLSQTIVSGTHKPADKSTAAGAGLTSDPRLRAVVGMLRNRRVGLTTAILRAANIVDTREMINCRKHKALAKYNTNVRKKAKTRRNAATGLFHVLCEVQVPGAQVTLTHALQGYCVAEYAN